MTSSTSPTICGSSALVGSSNSRISGSIASARAMATRCCCPPESWLGLRVDVLRHADFFQVFQCVFFRVGLVFFQDLFHADHAVLQNRHVVKQVERLEHHADLGAVGARVRSIENVFAVKQDDAFGGVSSRLMQRRSVDLPEPEAPMMHTTSLG